MCLNFGKKNMVGKGILKCPLNFFETGFLYYINRVTLLLGNVRQNLILDLSIICSF